MRDRVVVGDGAFHEQGLQALVHGEHAVLGVGFHHAVNLVRFAFADEIGDGCIVLKQFVCQYPAFAVFARQQALREHRHQRHR